MKCLLLNKRYLKVIALVMAVVMLVGSWLTVTVPVLSADTESSKPYIVIDGEKATELELLDDGKYRIEAVSEQDVNGYRWQIEDPESADRWIDISGSLTKYLWVTHALIGSMLKSDGSTALRCRLTTKEGDIYTEPLKVVVSLSVTAPLYFANASSEAKTVSTAARDGEHHTHTIVINYLFDNNAIAFEPYGASVAVGSDFKTTVTSPTVVGYAPFRRVGEDYIDASVVEIDVKNIQQDLIINVIYEPALVEFSIHHHLQNLLDDEYSIHYDLITKSQAITGTVVGEGLALTEEQLPGFKALAYEKLTVAADGSTVIEIRYDRNYYLVDFDMNGGYGSEPVYTRYGASVGANDPIRHGYVFDGWELVSYNGQTPTAEQQSKYALTSGATITVPDANLRYRARWITQDTTYTMVFWKENANDNGYSYWGYLDGLTAKSGTLVNGEDYIERVSGIDDEQYFTFNPQKTEKNVLVEGDGSTVVNVYYTRNYYTLTFKAKGLCTITPNHTHSDACYDLICDLGHVHNEDCVAQLECTLPEHKEHTAACIVCGLNEHIHGSDDCDCTKTVHTHTTECWNNIGARTTNVYRAPSNPEDGQIYRYLRYYIYIKGSWYRYNGGNVSSGDIVDPVCGHDEHTHGTDCACNETAHTHGDECYSDTLHTHSDACYSYSCGEDEHVHVDACRRLNCAITANHTHSSTCRNSGSTNTVKVIRRKYQQSLEGIWPVTDDNGVTYSSGERWAPSDSTYYSAVLVYISKMPPDDFTLTLNEANYKTFTMQYYKQVLPGQAYDVTYNGKYYKLDNTIKANYNYITKAEDFFDIEGFVQAGSNPAFGSNGQITTNQSALTVSFYYDRITDHYLEFNNNGTVLDNESVYGVMYGAPLKEYNFEPPYPANLEPNAYRFAGWYTSPMCFDGTEVDWDTIVSPEGDLMLYAKWAPITHNVRVFKDATMTEQIGETQVVDHKAFAYAPTGHVTNGNYVFQGWFYVDTVNGVQVEKAFVFNGIPVLKDMDIYAKWSSHVSVDYKISYKLFNTDTDIADPTVGSSIAGHNKTFDAKAGDQLYAGYQTGYYPLTNSHTITMSVDGVREFTFYYVYVENMPYRVQYVNELTGEKLCEDKVVEDNTLSVVTETFKRFDKMMPDAYQKRLVLSAEDTDGDGVYDDNVITFYYSSDEEHAYYRVVHYIRNIQGDTYREYRSEETVGIIGNTYSVSALTLTGFDFIGAKTTINGVANPVSGITVAAKLGSDGMLIELYYDRKTVEYTVKYIDSTTYVELAPERQGSGVFGSQVLEYAVSLEAEGYELVSDSVKMHTLSANAEHNIIEFLYKEKTVALKYQIIGPDGCGALSQYSVNLLAVSGVPNGTVDGSVPFVNNGFAFLGWYTDEHCTTPVNSAWVDAETNRLIPQKTGAIWTAQTYYAKFVALKTDLTITTKSTADIDANQTFIFNIKGKEGTDTAGIDLTVTVIGNGSTTVTELPTGQYTVTELIGWSWRYENDAYQKEISLEYSDVDNELIFDNSRPNGKWLDGNAVKDNRF